MSKINALYMDKVESGELVEDDRMENDDPEEVSDELYKMA